MISGLRSAPLAIHETSQIREKRFGAGELFGISRLLRRGDGFSPDIYEGFVGGLQPLSRFPWGWRFGEAASQL
jgi:hypothetical protein